MRRLTHLAMLLAVIGLSLSSVARAQPASTQPNRIPLPVADPAIQIWVQAIIKPSPPIEKMFTAMGEVMQAKLDRKLADEVWVQQVFLQLVQTDRNERVLGDTLLIMTFTRLYMGVDSTAVIRTLSPYLDGDLYVANTAEELIGVSMIQPGSDILGSFKRYLRSCGPADPSWKLVRIMYKSQDPDAVLTAAANVYLDEPAQRQVERARKELTILVLSYDLATDEQKPQWSPQILAKLTELSEHPHWCVRGYALAVINQNWKFAVARKSHWENQTDVPARLSQDRNPFVSAFANDLDKRIRARP